MKSLLRGGFLGLASVGMLLAVGSVNASTSGPFTTTTPIPSTLTDWSSSLSFPQFNPALGTLTSVKLDLSGSLSTIITVNNDSPSPSSGTVKTEVQFTVQDGGNNLNSP